MYHNVALPTAWVTINHEPRKMNDVSFYLSFCVHVVSIVSSKLRFILNVTHVHVKISVRYAM